MSAPPNAAMPQDDPDAFAERRRRPLTGGPPSLQESAR